MEDVAGEKWMISIASAAEDGGEMAAMDVEYKKLLLQVMIRQQLQG